MSSNRRHISLPVFAGLIIITAIITALLTLLVARVWLFTPEVTHVVLEPRETEVLNRKLQVLEKASEDDLSAGRYREHPEDRVIHLTEREINAIISRSPDLAGKVAIHLSENIISASILATFPEDFPVVSGRTARVETGLRIGHTGSRPSLIIEGVSFMGVPLPSAWLGGLKGRDLFSPESQDGSIGQLFKGVKDLRVEDGRIRIELAE